ncbi:MAG: hypothetical protein ACI9OO_001944, partial [Bacteroidia bacterium]
TGECRCDSVYGKKEVRNQAMYSESPLNAFKPIKTAEVHKLP